MLGELVGIMQPTACQTGARVADTFYEKFDEFVKLPNCEETARQKALFFSVKGVPKPSAQWQPTLLPSSCVLCPRVGWT